MQLPQLTAHHPSIQVLMDEGTIFLHPSPSPELPTNDPILRGVIMLDLPKPKRFRSLSVRLVRFVNVCFPDFAYEFGRSVQSQVSISGDNGDKLIDCKKGQHSFAFTLVIPSSSAPCVRSQYGRVYYKIVATAKGDGLIGTDLVTERHVRIVVNPSDDGETQDLDLRVEGFHDEIGPWGTIITSQHLTVGGFIHVDFFLPSPPRNIKILSAIGYIHTTYVLKSVEHPKQPEQTVKHKRRLFLVDATRKPEYQTEYSEDDFASISLDGNTATASVGGVRNGEAEELPSSPTQILEESSSSSPLLPTPSGSQAPSMPPSPSSASTFSRRFSIPVSARRATIYLLKPKSHTVSRPSSSSSRKRPSSPSSSSSDNTNARDTGSPMNLVPQGKAYQFSHLAGLPGDDIVRPSTVPGTNTPIKITHEVLLEVRFEGPPVGVGDNPSTVGGNRVKVLRIERPIVISSCCCTLESVLVPSYTAEPEPPPPSPSSPSSFRTSGPCIAATGGGGTGLSDVCACRRRDVSEGEQRAQLVARLMLQQSRGDSAGDARGGESDGGCSGGGRAYKALYRPVPTPSGP